MNHIQRFSVASRVGTTAPELFKGQLHFFFSTCHYLNLRVTVTVAFTSVSPPACLPKASHHFILYSSFSLDIALLTLLKTFISLLIFLQLQVSFDGLYLQPHHCYYSSTQGPACCFLNRLFFLFQNWAVIKYNCKREGKKEMIFCLLSACQ